LARTEAMKLQSQSRLSEQSGFTLVELVVVMTLLVTVIALASPSLAGFFAVAPWKLKHGGSCR